MAVQRKVFGLQTQGLGQLLPGVLRLDKFVEFTLKFQGFGLRGTNHRDDAREDLDAFRVAAHSCGS
ncbi:hypothetical protein D3C71_2183300 [compost metagenome]